MTKRYEENKDCRFWYNGVYTVITRIEHNVAAYFNRYIIRQSGEYRQVVIVGQGSFPVGPKQPITAERAMAADCSNKTFYPFALIGVSIFVNLFKRLATDPKANTHKSYLMKDRYQTFVSPRCRQCNRDLLLSGFSGEEEAKTGLCSCCRDGKIPVPMDSHNLLAFTGNSVETKGAH